MRFMVAIGIVYCGCSSATPVQGTLPAPKCAPSSYYDGRACQPRKRAAAEIDAGTQALGEFQVDQALVHLERARRLGPLEYEEQLRLYEQLGIAYSYLGRDAEAMQAFDTLLTLDPGHLLPYTLSPKATFVFERARKQAQARATTAIDVSWPRRLSVDDSVPLDVEVVADPKKFLARAVVHVRKSGAKDFGEVGLDLAPDAKSQRVVLPPLATTSAETLELFVTGFDAAGNEVLRWSSPRRPREIPLGYTPPTPWYRRWWVWAIAGGVVASGTGAAVFLIGRDPPDMVPASVDIR